MAFSVHLSHLEYLVIFQALDNDVLHDYLNHLVFVFFDDSLIFSRNLSEHQTHSHNVLHHLWKNKLCVKGEKCEFHVDAVSFQGALSHRKAEAARVQVVLDESKQTTLKHLQHFLGCGAAGSEGSARSVWMAQLTASKLIRSLLSLMHWDRESVERQQSVLQLCN